MKIDVHLTAFFFLSQADSFEEKISCSIRDPINFQMKFVLSWCEGTLLMDFYETWKWSVGFYADDLYPLKITIQKKCF